MFLEILKAILFGIVEGITEWLPISSTGHLILLNEFVRLDVSETFWTLFEVVIQLGAVLAVVLLYFRRLNPFAPSKTPAEKKTTWHLWYMVVLAILPSVFAGLFLDDWMDDHLYTGRVVAATLILYGVLFLLVEKRENALVRIEAPDAIDPKTALLIGCFQLLALIPGTSRSGATILGAILLGVARPAAAEFSFFLSIPTMAGASCLKAFKFIVAGYGITAGEAVYLAAGTVVAFLVSLVVIRTLVEYVRRHTFFVFGVYRILLGAAVALYFFMK